ncbi:hypothetical protein SARC_07241 [Sphaeroforma arctica JP610]|uniref:Integrase catalytic domain-containing protein n=1 Tax=Sphaeroforma arctica JP610 TaxID=667725 RepID=A0A0L0FWR3_9EUKA|nr:hypothetical protein SARC_07241 [Sphaeroforma arctica JP610]KNC80398.1 hypothetical protein SARC_07241 [Sphaeroforma arctica JP610]|eukprot:XP_014154300.1 hypothetical protein SARC_07241 [Sphaeroforma arctica JP610]
MAKGTSKGKGAASSKPAKPTEVPEVPVETPSLSGVEPAEDTVGEANSEVDTEDNSEDDLSDPKALEKEVSTAAGRLASVRVSPGSEAQDPSLPPDHVPSNIEDKRRKAGNFMDTNVGDIITPHLKDTPAQIRSEKEEQSDNKPPSDTVKALIPGFANKIIDSTLVNKKIKITDWAKYNFNHGYVSLDLTKVDFTELKCPSRNYVSWRHEAVVIEQVEKWLADGVIEINYQQTPVNLALLAVDQHNSDGSFKKVRIKRYRFAPLGSVTENIPWRRVIIDLVDLPTSEHTSDRYVCHFFDVASRFNLLYPAKDNSMQTVAELCCQVFADHGWPGIMCSDNVSEFCDNVMESLVLVSGICHKKDKHI